MNVLQLILEWSTSRPMWQRDALRCLVLNGDFSAEDITSLTEICKYAHGLAEPQETNPLTTEHIPDAAAGTEPVSLVSILYHRGVVEVDSVHEASVAQKKGFPFAPN